MKSNWQVFGFCLLISLSLGSEDEAGFCSKDNSEDGCEWNSLFKKLESIRKDCGEVCDTSIKPTRKGQYYDEVDKSIDCKSIFSNPHMDESADIKAFKNGYAPPKIKDLPIKLKNLFTEDGKLLMLDFYLNDMSTEKSGPRIWTQKLMDSYLRRIRRGEEYCGYGPEAANNVDRHLENHMENVVYGGHILVIGTEEPWIEGLLLFHGVENITVLDYNTIISEHPQINALRPDQLNQMFLNNELGPGGLQFDGIISYSSLEHSGLGRYGDALNPWGDLITMAKAWCLTKPKGKFLVGVPSGYDAIYFNAHRIYGKERYAQMFSNWNVVYTEAKMFKDGINTKPSDRPCYTAYCYEPIHILEKRG